MHCQNMEEELSSKFVALYDCTEAMKGEWDLRSLAEGSMRKEWCKRSKLVPESEEMDHQKQKGWDAYFKA